MSHFAVMIRVPGSVLFKDVPNVVADMLAPFQENNMGDAAEKYMVFHATEDEKRAEYATGTTSMVRLPSGKEVGRWEKQFKNPHYKVFANNLDAPEYVYPLGAVEFEKPVRDRYPTFEQYMAEYCEEKPDEKTGQWGYWENPNAKWDWYVIGGRWGGMLPVRAGAKRGVGDSHSMGETDDQRKPTRADYTRIADIDMDAVASQAQEEADKFWGEWVEFCDGKTFPGFDGPRDAAHRMGLIDCKDATELTGNEWRTIKWGHQNTPGVDRFDVLKEIDRDAAIALHKRMRGPLRPYAYLDGEGWHAPGRMGWWGISSDNAEQLGKYADQFMDWLKGGDRSDWAVIVDCHT